MSISEIWHACVPNLTWTHFRILCSETDPAARLWYMQAEIEKQKEIYMLQHGEDF